MTDPKALHNSYDVTYILNNPSDMTDPKILHKKFVQFGRMRHKLKNEMLAILPEIYKSGIYKKYASSIVEYAGKYGDIAKSTVIKRLRLEKKLEEKPHLKAAIKEAGVHKVAMVAKFANPETDEAFADKVKNMSKMAVQTLAKELRGKGKLGNEKEGKCRAVPEKIKIEMDEEMSFMFMKLKKKIGKSLSNKEIMRMILNKMIDKEFNRNETKTENNDKVKSVTGDTLTKKKRNGGKKISRYIPTVIKREALTKSNGKCAYPGCNRPVEIFHHRERFSKSRSHNSIISLCREHHEFCHNGLIKNEKSEADVWKLDIKKNTEIDLKCEADGFYRMYRTEALL